MAHSFLDTSAWAKHDASLVSTSTGLQPLSWMGKSSGPIRVVKHKKNRVAPDPSTRSIAQLCSVRLLLTLLHRALQRVAITRVLGL